MTEISKSFLKWLNTHIICSQAFSTDFPISNTMPIMESKEATCTSFEIGFSKSLSKLLCSSLQLHSSYRDADRTLLLVPVVNSFVIHPEDLDESALAEHTINLGHRIQLQNTTILSTKPKYMHRTIREAI
jgi:hypothetical protein